MKNDPFDLNSFFLGLCAGMGGLALLLTLCNTNPKQIDAKLRKEAVENNAAHYEVDSSGNATFKWGAK